MIPNIGPRISVVIANFNYGRFVGDAIASSLGLDWPNVEVVVVDDGSTDDSRIVIESFGTKVKAIFTENQGQREAVNLGFERCTGEVVIFLDSDDMLPANAGRVAFNAMHSRVSKVQFFVHRIDSLGKPLDSSISPNLSVIPSPREIRKWMAETSAYPTPPQSGNAYPRWFLERVLPLGIEVGNFADSGLLAAAPVLGDVVVCSNVLVGYRQHESNDSSLTNGYGRFSREVDRARRRWEFACDLGTQELDRSEAPLRRSRELLQFRVTAYRIEGREGALPGDSWKRLLFDTLRSIRHVGPESWWKRFQIAIWSTFVLTSPRPLVRRLVAIRYR